MEVDAVVGPPGDQATQAGRGSRSLSRPGRGGAARTKERTGNSLRGTRPGRGGGGGAPRRIEAGRGGGADAGFPKRGGAGWAEGMTPDSLGGAEPDGTEGRTPDSLIGTEPFGADGTPWRMETVGAEGTEPRGGWGRSG